MTNTKLHIYHACVLTVLLFASEMWILYARQERRLNSFHLWCLRKILGVHWEDNIPDTEVLTMAKSVSITAMLRWQRLW